MVTRSMPWRTPLAPAGSPGVPFVLAVTVLLCCAGVVGCGGGRSATAAATRAHRETVAARVCGRASQAARGLLGSTFRSHIASSDATNIECVIVGQGIRVDAIAQASPVAWTEYDTTTVHQVQAYSGLNQRGEIPRPVPRMGGNSAWIPAKQELVATNATQSRGGTYLTVTVTGHAAHGSAGLPVARAVTLAVLASAPRGSNPGPPPS